ncbi:MAG: TIGR03915 family putative DNA repair protein [Clostridia bacterium]|nr:TIGR03915 family putative DNA repair protein [Clostridia bacterium]
MIIFVCDYNVDGLLSALFISFTEKTKPTEVVDRTKYQPRFDAYIREIKTDKLQASRVKKALFSYGGNDIVAHLKLCLSSCNERAFTVAFNYAYYTLLSKTDVSEHLSEKCVYEFSYIVQKVLHERHVMSGFLRFFESANGVLYAKYSPDNDITSILAPHFFRRLGRIPFIIHDAKRNTIAISDGNTIKMDHTDLPANFKPSESEKLMNDLWKRYFKSINIAQRKNTRQQDGYFPRRYRHYAFETWEC